MGTSFFIALVATCIGNCDDNNIKKHLEFKFAIPDNTSLICVSFLFIDNKTSVEVDIPEQTQVIKGNRFVSLKEKIVAENHRCKFSFLQ